MMAKFILLQLYFFLIYTQVKPILEMPQALKQQLDQGGRVVDGTAERFDADYSLLYLVLFLLGLFYILIMHILSSSNTDRATQLERLSHQKGDKQG